MTTKASPRGSGLITRTTGTRAEAAGWDRPGTRLVDPDGRVLGVEGLRVADASIFPEIPRGTPALPTVVVGEHMAARLLAVD
jgi:choline dehydrogenase-like flavoprotein